MKKSYLGKKKTLGLLTEAEFFDALTIASGYMDPDTVRKVYNGMLQVLYSEIRMKGAVTLPALAHFHLLLSRPKRIRNNHMETSVMKPAAHQVRIAPVLAVREYFKALDERLDGEILDPRARL